LKLEDKINAVIGNKYDYKTANCWDLVKHLNDKAPDIDDVHTSIFSTAKKFRNYENKYKDKCKTVLFPKDGDIVLLGNGDCYTHAGIFFYSGVVHASKSGVVWQNLYDIKKLFRLHKAYRCE